MRIKYTYGYLENWDLSDFEDMELIYSWVDEGPSWNRVYEVYRDIFKPRWPTYVVELGAPDNNGDRRIVGLSKYAHLEENKERIENRRQVLDALEYVERVIKATQDELKQGEDKLARERIDHIASTISNLQEIIKK